jgi:hypothetical protein
MTHPSSELVEGRNTLTPETARELVEAANRVNEIAAHYICEYDMPFQPHVERVNRLRAAIERAEKEMGGK